MPYVGYRRREVLEIHRFDEIAVEAQFIGANQILFFARGRQHRHRQTTRARVATHCSKHFNPIRLRQFPGKQNDLWMLLAVPPHVNTSAEQSVRYLMTVRDMYQRTGEIALTQRPERDFGIPAFDFDKEDFNAVGLRFHAP